MIAGKSAKQIFTASLFCALRSCIIDGFAKTSLQANVFASWYNIHKAMLARLVSIESSFGKRGALDCILLA